LQETYEHQTSLQHLPSLQSSLTQVQPSTAIFGGNVTANTFIATGTTASIFPYASTTALSATTLCLSTDCRTAWPSSSGGAFPFITTTNFNQTANSTTTALWLRGSPISLMASSTSVFDNASTTLFTSFGNTYLAQNGGKVGIGTSSPYAVLSVVGNGGVVAESFNATSTIATSTLAGGLNVGNGGLVYDFTSGITSVAALQTGSMNFDDDAGVINWVNLPTVNAASGVTESYTASIDDSPLLTLSGLSDGSGGVNSLGVSIGSTTPYSKLSVWGDSATTGSLFAAINSASSTLFQINNNGNVAVGSTSPGTLFGISGVASFTTGTSTVVATGGLNLLNGCYAIRGTCISGGTGSGTGTVNSGTNGQFAYYAADGTAVSGNSVLDFANSNIGIGTTSPYAKLSVVGQIVGEYFTATSTTATSTIAGSLTVGTGVGDSFFQIGSDSNLWTLSYLTSDNSFRISSSTDGSSNVAFTIVKGGNVGIGTTTPFATLSVNPIAGKALNRFYVGSTTETNLIVTNSGAVGIGTQTPAAMFDFFGAHTTGIGLGRFKSNGGTAQFTLDTTGAGDSAMRFNDNGSTVGAVGSFHATGNVAITDSTLGIERLSVGSTGNVGIATTSPHQKLTVNGNVYVAGFITSTSTTAASTFPYASTTALSAATICITTDCRSAWPSSGGGTFPFVSTTNYGITVNSTTSPLWFRDQIFGSSTAIFGGNVTANTFIATGTTASIFPYASTTALSATTLCISTDCRSAWPSSGGGTFPFLTTTNYGITVNSTTSPLWFRDQIFASSSAIIAGTVTANNFFATGTAVSTFNGGILSLASSTLQNFTGRNATTTNATSTTLFSTLLSANTICILTDCRAAWPSSGGGAFPFITTTNFNQTANSTTTALWLRGSPISLMASSTSIFDYASTTALTSFGNTYLAQNGGSVGIGTTSMSDTLTVGGSARISGHLGIGSEVQSASTGTVLNINEVMASAGTLVGTQSTIKTLAGSTNSASLTGAQFNVDHSGNSTANNLTGVSVNVTTGSNSSNATTIYGIFGDVHSFSDNTIGDAYGARFLPIRMAGAGSVANAYGLKLEGAKSDGGGTITNSYGLYLGKAINTGSSLLNNYGLYLEDQSAAGSLNSYNIFSLGTTSKNYFNGLVGIGTSSPYAKLSVNGEAVITGNVLSSYFTATSTTATSTFPNIDISNNAKFGEVIVKVSDGTQRIYRATASTNAARGTALVTAVNAAAASSTILIGPGTFDIGTNNLVLTGANISLIGSGIDVTVIKSQADLTVVGPIVVPSSGSVVGHMTIWGTLSLSSDGGTGYQAAYGFDSSVNTVAATSTVYSIKGIGDSDGFYFNNSSATSPYIVIRDSIMQTKYDAFAVFGSRASSYDLYNNTLSAIGPSGYTGADSNAIATRGSGNINNIVKVYGGNLIASNSTANASAASGVYIGVPMTLELYGTRILTSDTNLNNSQYDLNMVAAGVVRLSGVAYDPSKVNKTSGTLAYTDASALVQSLRNATINFGIGTTSPYQKLSVAGGNIHVGGVVISTSTTASNIFPYASTTALTANTLCILTDCRSAWPSAGGGAFPFLTTTNYGITVNSTTSPLWFRDQIFASSSAIIAGDVKASTFTATSSTATSTFAGGLSVSGGINFSNNTIFYQNGVPFLISDNVSTGALSIGPNSASVLALRSTNIGNQAGRTSSASAVDNTIVGWSSNSVNTTGARLSAFGSQALVNATSGSDNDAFGYRALDLNTTGTFNSAFGDNALHSLTVGIDNVAVGYSAGYGNTTGTSTVSVGAEAGAGNYSSYSVKNGVHLGAGAGFNIRTGADGNTFLGFDSGYDLTTGANNIAIGANVTVPSITGNQQLNIGNLLYGTGIYNGASVSSTSVATGMIGIGTSTPWRTLSVNGSSDLGTNALAGFFTATSTSASTFAGSVGVGVAVPTAVLDVAGISNTALHVSIGDQSIAALVINNNSYSTNQFNGALSISKSDTGFAQFINNQAAALTIGPTGGVSIGTFNYNTTDPGVDNLIVKGNVGIGTTSPYAKLSVAGDVVAARFVSTSTISNIFPYASTTAFSVADSAYIGNSITDKLLLNVGEVNYASVSTTTIPNNVVGAWSISTSTLSSVVPIFSISTLNSSVGGVAGFATSSPWAKLSVEMGANHPSFVVSNQGSSTPAFIVSGVNQNGSVGIATSSPSANSVLSASGSVYLGNGPASTLTVHSGIINYPITSTSTIINGRDNAWSIATSSTNRPIFSISTRSSPEGLVGIATTSPWAKFSLEFGTLDPAMVVSNQGSSTPSFIISGTNNNGAVGIATSSPSQLNALNVSGSTYLGNGTGSTLTIHAGTINYPVAATTTLAFKADALTFATSTSAQNPVMDFSFSTNGATSTVGFFVSTTTGLTAGVGAPLPSNMKNMVILGNGKIAASMVVPNGAICVDDDGWCTASTTGQITGKIVATGRSDIAEVYTTNDSTIEPGDIVSTVSNTDVGKAHKTSSLQMMGIVSTAPGFLLGLDSGIDKGKREAHIALAGRVPVKVNLEGGPITAGDFITISSSDGVGMKANPASSTRVVAMALEDFNSQTPGKILAFIDRTMTTGTTNDFAALDLKVNTTIDMVSNLSKTVTDLQQANATTAQTLQDLTARVNLLSGATTTDIFASSTLLASVASSTANQLASSSPFITRIANEVVKILASTGSWVADQMTAKVALIDVVQANTVSAGSITATSSLTVGSQTKPTGVTIFDKANGDAYCLNLVNGALVPSKGACDVQAPLSFPVAAPYTPDLPNAVVQTPGATTTVLTTSNTTTVATTTTATSTPVIDTATSTPPVVPTTTATSTINTLTQPAVDSTATTTTP
jgi:hypothetical protein